MHRQRGIPSAVVDFHSSAEYPSCDELTRMADSLNRDR